MDHKSDIHANTSAITVASSILLGTAYVFCAVSCVRFSKSHVLQDLLLMYGSLPSIARWATFNIPIRPFFGTSLVGLLNISLNISIRRLYPLDTLSIAVVSLASASTVCFGSAALYNSQIEKYIPHFLKHNNNFFKHRRRHFNFRRRDSAIDDAELQRRQLLRLYLKNDSDRAPSTDASRSTFRIDLPRDSEADGAEEMVTPPQSAYERQRAVPPSGFNQNLFMVPEPAPAPSAHSRHSSTGDIKGNRSSGGSVSGIGNGNGGYRPVAARSLYAPRTTRNSWRPAELGDL